MIFYSGTSAIWVGLGSMKYMRTFFINKDIQGQTLASGGRGAGGGVVMVFTFTFTLGLGARLASRGILLKVRAPSSRPAII